jgi:cobalt ECF transporter T component CbiQ
MSRTKKQSQSGRSRGLIERSLSSFVEVLQHAFYAEELAKKRGLLQKLDPRVKIVAILPLIVVAALARKVGVIAILFLVALVLAIVSRVPLSMLAKRVWLGVLGFTGIIAVPALFLTPGRAVYSLPFLNWAITAPGLRAAAYLTLRAETAATFSILLVLCTRWSSVLKALRVLRLPMMPVVILGMTYRYIFLLLHTAHDMFESRRSRMVGELPGGEMRRVVAASAGVLISKTLLLGDQVYLAMRARGFRGEVYLLDEFRTSALDWIMLTLSVLVTGLALWFGR